MKAPVQTQSNDYQPAPEGNQVGILVGLYYFGPQKYTYKGEEKIRQEVRVTFELPNAKRKFGDDQEEKPYLVSKSGSYSMHEKAFLRKAVEAVSGKKMTDGEAEAFSLEDALGKPCLINITHYEANGNTYAGIEGVSPLPDGMTAPERTNPTKLFNVASFTMDEYNQLPDWMKKKVDEAGGKPKEGDSRIPERDQGLNPNDILF